MRVAIHQPNYIPWCGYFAKMAHCDSFIFLDDAQLPQGRSYVYRCRIRRGNSSDWLSIPLQRISGSSIAETLIDGEAWKRKHLTTLRHQYSRTPYFNQVFAVLEPAYQGVCSSLADFNVAIIQILAGYLGVTPAFSRSSELKVDTTSDDRLIELTKRVGGSVYLSGAGGQNYQDPAKFEAHEIRLDVRVYEPVCYPSPELFQSGLSLLDALFYLGPKARDLLVYPETAG